MKPWSVITTSFLLLTMHQLGYSQNNIPATGSNFTTKQSSDFLSHHNMARKEFKIPPLQWDAEIAAYAQEWAEYLALKKRCKMIHREEVNKNPKDYGENIYWVSGSANFNPVNASEMWYEEKSIFENNNRQFDWRQDMGHYTQMIWGNTTHVGAGYATCPSGAVIVVASYNPPGNYKGSNPF